MSNILNQKEEVLKVELTSHGRKLLGMGVFKPFYFSFIDDSVIYDHSYSGFNDENINSIQDRILNNSVCFSSMNLLSKENYKILGKSSPLVDSAPSWSIVTLNGQTYYKPEESNYYKKKFSFEPLECIIMNDKDGNTSLQSSYILLDLKELNIEEDVKNFEIELIYFDNLLSGSKRQIQKKLYFNDTKNNILDDIIYDEEELPSGYYDAEINDELCSYYFDILVDEEIDTDYIVSAGKNVYETITGFTSKISTLFDQRGKSLLKNSINTPTGEIPVLPGSPLNSLSISGVGFSNPREALLLDINLNIPTNITITPDGDLVQDEREYDGSTCTINCCP